MDDFTNRLIIENLQTGNTKVFEHVFKLFYSPLCAYSFEFVKDKSLAEDIVFTVFQKFLETSGNLSFETQIKSYLYRSVHNQCLNYLKHKKIEEKHKKKTIENAVKSDNTLTHMQESVESNLIAQELQETIDKAIDALPEQARKIFKMSRYDGLKYNEIAEKLEVSVNTIETQMSRCLAKLRIALKEYLPYLILFLLGRN